MKEIRIKKNIYRDERETFFRREDKKKDNKQR